MSSVEYLHNGRYVLLKKLGEGGKGVVYKARDTFLNRVVAIKLLKAAVSEEAYARFMKEAQTIGRLNHPNVVSIHDIGKEDDKHFLVIEFVDGMSLRELLGTYPEGKCDIQTALRIAMDVCRALHYAHSQGILHRDVKPENIILTREDTAKLMDFGLAEVGEQPGWTKEGMIVGAAAYVAPEIALGRGADARSDLFSFGVVLYEMVTGKVPFVREDGVKVTFSHIHDFPVPPSRLNAQVPQALSDCIMKLLEEEPERRFQSAEDVSKVLKEISEEFLRENLACSRVPNTVVSSPRLVAAKEIQLIDRVDEMNLLRKAVDDAVRGEGGLSFLYGEAGIGKTRLARELRTYAHLRGMQVLYGRSPALFRMDGVAPYVLWDEVIRDYVGTCDLEQLRRVIGSYPAEVAKLVPEVGQKLGAVPQSFPISPEHEQYRFFEAVSQFIINISKEAPLLVILDDLQWTDPSSLLILHYLARGVDKTSLLILGAYRNTEIDSGHPLTSLLTELDRERLPRSVFLERMSLNDISEMIKSMLEQDDIPAEFCRMVHEKTRGNPFFTEEVVKSLKEEEIIYREKDRWTVREFTKIEFPETVKSLLKVRINRLDDECLNILTMASFIGNDFTFESLRGVVGVEDDKLIEPIEKILKSGLIKEKVVHGEDVYSFADAMIRDAVHEEVSHMRHNRLHGIVGRALEKVYANNIDKHFGELATHFLEGGEKDKALDYFLKAGDKAVSIYANDEASSYFQSALHLLENRDDKLSEKGYVLENLGDIKGKVAEYKDSKMFLDKALLLWQKLDDKQKVADVHRKIATLFWNIDGNIEGAKEHYDQALKILGTEPEGVGLGQLYLSIQRMYFQTGFMNEALSWGEKALKLAEKLGEFNIMAWANCRLASVLMVKGDIRKGREYAEKALKISLENNYAEIANEAYLNLGIVLPVEEDEKRLDSLEKAHQLAKRAGITSSISRWGSILAWTCAFMGNTEKSLRLAEESVALDKKANDLFNLSWSMEALGFVYHVLGEWDKSEQCYKDALSNAERAHSYQVAAYGNGALGILFFDRGEYSKARECFDRMGQILEKAGAKLPPILNGFYVTVNAMTFVELGEMEKANAFINEVQESAVKMQNGGLIASVDLSRAIQLGAERKWTESLKCFEKGLQELETLNARRWGLYWFARMLFENAKVYLEQNAEGDRERAYSLLNQALELLRETGAKKDVEKILAKKKLLTA